MRKTRNRNAKGNEINILDRMYSLNHLEIKKIFVMAP